MLPVVARSYLCPVPALLAPTPPADHPDWRWELPGPEVQFPHSGKKKRKQHKNGILDLFGSPNVALLSALV